MNGFEFFSGAAIANVVTLFALAWAFRSKDAGKDETSHKFAVAGAIVLVVLVVGGIVFSILNLIVSKMGG